MRAQHRGLRQTSSVQTGDEDYCTVQLAQLEKKGESTTMALSDAENQMQLQIRLRLHCLVAGRMRGVHTM